MSNERRLHIDIEPLVVEFEDPDEPVWQGFYEQFFGPLHPDSEGKVTGLACPNTKNHSHGDKKPSGTLYLKSGVYVCGRCVPSTGSSGFSPFTFLTEIMGWDKREASDYVTQYRNDQYKEVYQDGQWRFYSPFKPVDPPFGAQPLNEARLQAFRDFVEEAQKRLSPDLPIVQEYILARGLKYETLVHFGFGYVPENIELGQKECLVIPFYENGKVRAIRGRDAVGNKGAVKGSNMIPHGVDEARGHEVIVVVEGESDKMMLWQIFQEHGVDVPVVSVPTNRFSHRWLRQFRHVRKIVVIPQDDDAGQELPASIRKVFRDTDIRVVTLPFQDGYGKDLCEWIMWDGHSGEELVKMLKTFLKPPKLFEDHVYTMERLLKEGEKPIPWLINNVIARGSKTLIQGPPKQLKTWVALNLLRALYVGGEFCGRRIETEKIKALIVEEEHSTQAFANRVQTVFGDIRPEGFQFIHRAGVCLYPENEAWKKVLQQIEMFEPDVLILDPLRSIFEGDENSSEVMKAVFRPINDLLDAYPHMAVIVLDHTAKKTDDLLVYMSRGSSVKGAEQDTIINVRKYKVKNLPQKSRDKVKTMVDDVDDETVIAMITTESRDGVDLENEALVFRNGLLEHVPDLKITASKVKNMDARVQKTLELLLQRPWTQEELSKQVGVGQQTVGRYVEQLRGAGYEIEEDGGYVGRPKTYKLVRTPEGLEADDEETTQDDTE